MQSAVRPHHKTDDEVMAVLRQVVGEKTKVPTSDLIKAAMWIWETSEADATEIVSQGGLLRYVQPSASVIQCHERLEQGYMKVNAGAFFIALKQNLVAGQGWPKINANVVNRRNTVWGAKLTAKQTDTNTMVVDIHPKTFKFVWDAPVENPKIFITYEKQVLFEYPVTHATAREVTLEFGDKMLEFQLDPDKVIPYMPKLTLVA